MKLAAIFAPLLFSVGCAGAVLREVHVPLSEIVSFSAPEPAMAKVDDAGTGLEKRVTGDRVFIQENTITQMLSQKEKLVFPAKLAVVKIERYGHAYRPEALKTEELERYRKAFEGDDRIEGVETLSTFFLTNETDLLRLRYAAARIQCPLLFITMKDTAMASGWNGSSALNWLILPAFFIHGQTVKAECAMEGVLIAVARNTAPAVATAKAKEERDIHNFASSSEALKEVQLSAEEKAERILTQELARKLGR